MDKNIKRAMVSAVVLLYPLLSSASVQAAGFSDWITGLDNINKAPKTDKFSFAMIYSWGGPFDHRIAGLQEESKNRFIVKSTHTVRATGYSSTPDQTDSTPFITASGTHVQDGTLAANFYINGRKVPFGTLIRIPEVYGDKIFVVEDRMNSRYTNNIDVWFAEISDARLFGSKKVTIEIVEELKETDKS